MPYPITTSAYGIWSLNQVRSAELGNVWPAVGDAVTSPADNPSGVSVASDVWSLRDAYKAEAGGDWPEIYVPPTYYTHPTYGTLVGAFTSNWTTSPAIPVTEGVPQPESSDIILSNSDFQYVRAATTDNLVYYVFGPISNTFTYYVSYYRSQIENSNRAAAPTTTINPNNFAPSPDGQAFRPHWWDETNLPLGSGADYSMVFRESNTVGLYDFSPIKRVATNHPGFSSSSYVYDNTAAKFYIFYK